MKEINYASVAQEIIDTIGGKENIISVNCCATRIKVKLYDNDKIDSSKLEKLEYEFGIPKGFFFSNGFLQLIAGSTNTHRLYNEMINILGELITEEHSIQHSPVNPGNSEDVADTETVKKLSESILYFKKAFDLLVEALNQ